MLLTQFQIHVFIPITQVFKYVRNFACAYKFIRIYKDEIIIAFSYNSRNWI